MLCTSGFVKDVMFSYYGDISLPYREALLHRRARANAPAARH